MKYRVTLKGLKPGMLMHRHNIPFDDRLAEWRQEPGNKAKSKPGDDRSPSWRWLGYCHSNGEHIVLPCTMISASLIDAAKKTIKKGKETYKATVAAGVLFEDLGWPILTPHEAGQAGDMSGALSLADKIGGLSPGNAKPKTKSQTSKPFNPISINDFDCLMDDDLDYKRGEILAKERGFELFLAPVTVGRASHARVRPLFEEWRASGDIYVVDEEIDQRILEIVLENAGRIKGLGDWRPSANKPGPYGRFTYDLKPVK